MKKNSIHPQPEILKPRFHSLKNSVDYIKKAAGSSGIGPCLQNIIPPLPFGAYKEMTWWAHTTTGQIRLNELITKVKTLKTQLLHYHAITEKPDDKMIPDEEILMYEKLSNTEIRKYHILHKALKKQND